MLPKIQKTEYIYARIKDVAVNEGGVEELFLFAGLTIRRLYVDGRETVEAIASEVYEALAEQSPIDYLKLPNEVYRITVEKKEFERLEKTFKENLSEFFLYKQK